MGKFTFYDLVWSQYTSLPPVLTKNLNGKSVIVVGANTGIGFEAAKHFAKMKPARLILACRNEKKGQDAAALIAQETSYVAEVQILDLSSFDSVVAFAKRLEGDPVDILMANAAVAWPDYRPTQDGWEEALQVNHLSTALLSFLLLPNMVRASELHVSTSRLVVVCSEMHFWAQLGKDLQESESGVLSTLSDKDYCTPEAMAVRYPVSKLLNVFFTRAFAQHLKTSSVVPSTVNPGFCVTDLTRNAPFRMRLRIRAMQFAMGRTAEQGARQLIWAALGPDGKDGPHIKHHMSGAYVSNSSVHEPSDLVISKEGYEVQEKIWHETIDILSKVAPSVRSIVNQYLSD